MKKLLLLFFPVLLFANDFNIDPKVKKATKSNKADYALYFDSPSANITNYAPSSGLLEEGSVLIGQSGNLYGILRSTSNMIDANQETNSVAFIHRNDPDSQSGSTNTTSQFRFGKSTDGGETFETNIGPLNVFSDNTSGDNTHARYPQIAVVNRDASNTDADNAYIAYMGATHAGATGNDTWDGYVAGSASMTGDPSTFTEELGYEYDGNTLIPGSLVHSANGNLFALNYIYDGVEVSEIILYSGELDAMGMTSWSSQLLDTQANISFDGTSNITTPQISFSPDGQIGYIFYAGNVEVVEGLNTGLNIQDPVYLYSDDAGATWTAPQTFSVDAFGGAIDTITTVGSGEDIVLTPYIDSTHDIVVDKNGSLHVGATVFPREYDYNDPAPAAGFQYYPTLGLVSDIVIDGATKEYELLTFSNIISPNSLDINGIDGFINDTRTQVSRNAAGDKIFFTYLDSIDAEIAVPGSAYRDLYGFSYDIDAKMTTEVVNFTANNADWVGKAYYATTAPNTLVDGDDYKVPVVFTEIPNDDLSTCYYHYFQDAVFAESDFNQEPNVNAYEPTLPTGDFTVTPLNNISYDLSVDGAEGFDFIIWDFGNGTYDTTTVSTNIAFFENPAVGEEDMYTITVTLYNQAGSVSYSEEVTVSNFVDTEAPVVSVEYNGNSVSNGDVILLEADVNTEFFCPEATASDDSGDLTGQIVETGCSDVVVTVAGDYVVTYEVSDAAGNSDSFTVTFTVQDTSAPLLSTLNGQGTQNIDCNGALTDPLILFAVLDNGLPQGISNFTLNQTGDFNAAVNGEYIITYTVTDASGNTSAGADITYSVSGCTGTAVQTLFGGVVSVLPNPTSGELFVDLTQTTINAAVISVFDIQGRMVTSIEADNTSAAVRLDLSNYANGVYMVQINAGEAGIAVDRIILSK